MEFRPYYEVWEGSDGTAVLVVTVTRKDPIESLTAMTKVAPLDEIEQLKTDFETGREATARAACP